MRQSWVSTMSVAPKAAGCAANTQSTENLLSAAGFRTIVANTPQRQQHLKMLPPNKVVLVQRNGKNYYVYADPAHYQIYVGNPFPVSTISAAPLGPESGPGSTCHGGTQPAGGYELGHVGTYLVLTGPRGDLLNYRRVA